MLTLSRKPQKSRVLGKRNVGDGAVVVTVKVVVAVVA